jgi:arginine-tRNA-protein transferase
MHLFPPVFENRIRTRLLPEQLDQLLAQGWRHFGPQFFRYSYTLHQEEICMVIPLRIHINEYTHGKSARKILAKLKNAGFTFDFVPFAFSPALEELFLLHRERFTDNIPESLQSFVGSAPLLPFVPTLCTVHHGKKLIAASILDEGMRAVSSVYGMFHPEYAAYSLGKATMLLELDYAKAQGMDYYYHGYCYNVPSFYDYKKEFNALYAYNWAGQWHPFHEVWK